MRRAQSSNARFPDAHNDMRESFRCTEHLISIHNSNGRTHRYLVWGSAALLIVFPLVRAFVPGTIWFAFDEHGAGGWFGLIVYLFAIFACISAGFWWSTIRMDLKTLQVEHTRRWGPFRTQTVVPLTAFEQVKMERDSDGDITVELVGSQQMQIVWGRTRTESVRIAREVSARTSLPLVGAEATR